jgi:hypothetical protein
MVRIPLLGGAYQQASVIAGAQRSINLYPEVNAERAQAPVPVTHYSRPGLTALKPPIDGVPQSPVGTGRALYAATTGDLFCVINQGVYSIDINYNFTLLGMLPAAATTPVIVTDNGITVFLVDGTNFGGQIDLTTKVFTQITDPNFFGGTRTDFLDGFVIFNKPNTIVWYCTQFYSNTFNNLFVGQKTAWPDLIQTLIVNERQVWIFGKYKGEVWYNAGLAPFPFTLISGSIVEHGVAGPYAVTRQDVNIYWLSESPEGARLAMQGAGITNQAQKISTHAIEHEWLTYPTVADCICTTYQIRGHNFVEWHFPTADRTWVYDGISQEWHEKAHFDINGVQHRSLDLFKAYAYGLNLTIDWTNGQLYQIDENAYTDAGQAIVYRRGFPHLLNNQNYDPFTVWRIMADMECGTGSNTGPTRTSGPSVLLRISRDRGFTFTTHSIQTLGVPGAFNSKPTFNRCGMGYDFVPELQWEGPMRTALNGVFADIEDAPGYE